MNEHTVLEVAHLRISLPGEYAHQPVVSDLSFSIERGRTLAIVGESYLSASPIALALTGLLPPGAQWSGTITLSSRSGQYTMTPGPAPDLWRRIRGAAISMVLREPARVLNPVMKVGRQLTEAVAAHEPPGRKGAREQAVAWMGKVGLPDPGALYHSYPHQLTGAQQQRLMIAMAMCGRPDVLIADEPTASFDVMEQKSILVLLQQLQEELGTAMILIMHDPALAAAQADDVLVLYGGQVAEYGPSTAVFETPQHPYTGALLACRPGPGAKGKRLPVVSDFMTEGVVPRQQLLSPVKASSNVLLQVRHLRVWFPRERNLMGTPIRFLRAVEDVSFDLHQGEVLALIGVNGCGKSTISRAIIGLQPVESGLMIFNDRDLAHLDANGWRAVRKDVQMIFRDPYLSLSPGMTIAEILREPLMVHRIVPGKEAEAEVRRLIGLVQLSEDVLHRYPHQCSVAQQHRIAIARALALRPKLIVCDDSVPGPDVGEQAQLLNLLKELQAEFRLTYLFISHDLNAVHYFADRVLVMEAGRIVERGTAEEVLRHPEQAYTRKLVAAIP